MKSRASGVTSIILIIMAISSLISMFLLLRIDGIIHGDLYKYGLQFSYQWASPYWTMTAIIFAVWWFNIIAAVAFQLYIFAQGRREAEITSRQNEALKLGVPNVQKPIAEETVATEEIERFEGQKESQEPVESQASGQLRTETESQKEIGEAELNEIQPKRAQEIQSTARTDSEKTFGEESRSLEGVEQKTSSRDEDKDELISADSPVVEGTGLTDAEMLIYDGVAFYFHPSTRGRSFKTDFPDKEFKQRKLKRLYARKKINREKLVEELIKAFPTRLEEDVSNKILEYLEEWLHRRNNTEDSLAIVEECRQDKEKWNALWKKICRQYERELQQELHGA